MNEEIKVHIVKRKGRKNLVLRYVDPVTGKEVEKSAGTTRRREAEKLAGAWESDLRNRRYKPPSKVLWSEFRSKYESRLERPTSDSTTVMFASIADVFERIVDPERLESVKRPQLNHFMDVLQRDRKTIWTIRTYVNTILTGLR